MQEIQEPAFTFKTSSASSKSHSISNGSLLPLLATKSEDLPHIYNDVNLSNDRIPKTTFISQTCEFSNVAPLLCSNQSCSQPGFLCLEQQCDCLMKMHPKCQFLLGQPLMDRLLNRKISENEVHPTIKQSIQTIRKILDELIEKLSIYRDALQIFTQNYGLSEQEYKLIELLKKSTDGQGQVTGRLVHLVKECLDQSKQRARKSNGKQLSGKLAINSPLELFQDCQKECSKLKEDIQRKFQSMFFWFKGYCSSSEDILQFTESREILKHAKEFNWEEILSCVQQGKKPTEMQQLNLFNRNMKTIPKEMRLMKSLTKLNLFKNCIIRIENLDTLSKLRVIDLKKNQVQKIENLEKLKSLTRLFLNENHISVIQNLPPSLVELYLDKNRIFKLENLSHLKKLELLSLNDNKISKLENIQNLPSIKQIRLKMNQIRGIAGQLSTPEETAILTVLKDRGVKILYNLISSYGQHLRMFQIGDD